MSALDRLLEPEEDETDAEEAEEKEEGEEEEEMPLACEVCGKTPVVEVRPL